MTEVMAPLDTMASLEGDMLGVSDGVSVVDKDMAAISEAAAVEGQPTTGIDGDKTSPEQEELKTGTTIPEEKKQMDVDVLVVGGGFSGISAIHKLRQRGYNVQGLEAGSDLGGVWYWNRYPGARVDSESPFYQLSIPEVYNTWNFSKRFPDHFELRRYMAHVDKVLDLKKDIQFNARVNSATFDTEKGRWTVTTEAGHTATCKYLMLCCGVLHRRYIPDFAGLSDYKGEIHHSGFWPEGLDVKGKKVALIGAGATAVQITQEVGKLAEQLTIFLRRPSMGMPMGQRDLSESESLGWRTYLGALFAEGRKSRSGFPGLSMTKGVFDASPEERETYFEDLWSRGAFNYQSYNYKDMVLDKQANRVIYDFWAKKIRARITDPVKQEIMAPIEPPYLFGTKRNPLVHDYYEIIDQPNVELVNLTKNPLKTFTEKGMVMSDDKLREFDIVILATGFDSFTGSLTNMGLKNKDGKDMREVWKDGVWTYLGLQTAGFPNMFQVFSPQAPTALTNGPSLLECQVDIVCDAIDKLEAEGVKSIEPQHKSEIQWKEMIQVSTDRTLFPLTNSWWNTSNVPGKKAESMNYLGGIALYEKDCRSTFDGWKGFEIITKDGKVQQEDPPKRFALG